MSYIGNFLKVLWSVIDPAVYLGKWSETVNLSSYLYRHCDKPAI